MANSSAGSIRTPARSRNTTLKTAAHRAARPGRGLGRQYLVHRQLRRPGRQARSEDRRSDRIQDAGSEVPRPAQPQRSTRAASSGSPRSNPMSWAGSTPRPARSRSSRCRRRGSRPYGILINSRGVPVLVRVRHQQARHHRSGDIGDQGIHPAGSRLAPAPHRARPRRRRLVLGLFARLSRPPRSRDRRGKEWPSPSGPQSQPYGIVFAKGAVWYNELFAKPNTIVRFDPETENSRPGRSPAAATSCARWMSPATAIR